METNNFIDPEQQERLKNQKMDAMKVIMSELIDNPVLKEKDNLKKVINFLDKQPTLKDQDDRRPNAPT